MVNEKKKKKKNVAIRREGRQNLETDNVPERVEEQRVAGRTLNTAWGEQ